MDETRTTLKPETKTKSRLMTMVTAAFLYPRAELPYYPEGCPSVIRENKVRVYMYSRWACDGPCGGRYVEGGPSFSRIGHRYCSLDCLKRHRATLDAAVLHRPHDSVPPKTVSGAREIFTAILILYYR